jgi:hypothetical protein
MALEFVQPRDKFMLKRGVIGREPVIGHLRTVLNSFANKPEYTCFYIGITNNLDTRLQDHQRRKPQFRLMCPIYEEPAAHVDSDSFDLLEREALRTFQSGVVHPQTRQVLLRCDNIPGGAPPKRYLYILVG